jgi:hypothetical protein
LEIEHCEVMARAIVHHPQPTHEDFAIASINPLPTNALHFLAVHEVVQEFVHVHDRDLLVNNSLHP